MRLFWAFALNLMMSLPFSANTLISRAEAVGHTGVIRAIAYTPDGKYIIIVSEDKIVRIWERETGRLVRVIRGEIGPGCEGKLYALSVSPDGKYIPIGEYPYGAGKKGVYILIYTPDGRLIERLVGHSEVIQALSFSSDGRYLASGSGDYTVIIWDTRS